MPSPALPGPVGDRRFQQRRVRISIKILPRDAAAKARRGGQGGVSDSSGQHSRADSTADLTYIERVPRMPRGRASAGKPFDKGNDVLLVGESDRLAGVNESFYQIAFCVKDQNGRDRGKLDLGIDVIARCVA